MRKNLDDFMYVQVVNDPESALANANYPTSGGYIDTKGYRNFAFLVCLGDTTLGTPDFAVYQDTSAAETGSIKVVSGASKTDVAAGDVGKWFSIEFNSEDLDAQNSFRYVTLKVSGTASDIACIIFLAWNARREPVTQPANYLEAVVA